MGFPEATQKIIDDFFAAIQPVEEAYRHDTFNYLALRHPGGFVLSQASLMLNTGPVVVPDQAFRSANVMAGCIRLADIGLTRMQVITKLSEGSFQTPYGEMLSAKSRWSVYRRDSGQMN